MTLNAPQSEVAKETLQRKLKKRLSCLFLNRENIFFKSSLRFLVTFMFYFGI